MALFGNVFSAFTGDPAEKAAQQNAQLFQQYGTQARSALGQGQQQAVGALTQGQQQAINAYNQGQGLSEGAYNQAIGAYAPLSALSQKYGGATSLQLDALGVNGPEGQARARAAFQAGPGYQWQVDQATDAAARKAASLGIAGTGNTLAEISSRAGQLANQEYGGWLDRLGGYVNPELAATSGAAAGTAGGYRSLADMYGSTAQGRAGVYGNTATGLGNIYTTGAQNLTNVLGNVAGGQSQSNQQAAQAQMGASGQFWNTLANLGGLAGGLYFGGKK